MLTPVAFRKLVPAALLPSWGMVLLAPWLSGWLGVCTYGTARFGGLVLAAGCSLPLLVLCPAGTRAKRIVGVVLAVNVVLQLSLPSVAFNSFWHGFATRVLQAGSISDWAKLPSQVGAPLETAPTKSLSRDQLPRFVARMYPAYRPIWCSLTGTPQAEGTAVVVWWRDIHFCIGVAVGANYPRNSQTLHVRQLGNDVYLIAFQLP